MTLSIVTTTTARPLAFSLLEKYMARQTIRWTQWLVVGHNLDGYTFSHGQEVVEREHTNGNSLLANWLTAIPFITGDVVIVAEDDDFYHPDYLETLSRELATVQLAGVKQDLYFKIRSRKFMRMRNEYHASLSATGFRRDVLAQVERCCTILCPNNKNPFIDMYLWAEAEPLHGLTTSLIPNVANDGRALHVGIKQMPGAVGLGLGHADEGSLDTTFEMLAKWIGREDTRAYVDIQT